MQASALVAPEILVPPEPGTVLYRFFDAAGRLLYVGITLDLVKRWGDHMREKRWWRAVDTIKLQHFDVREDAAAAERRAIVAERPLWNIAHNARPQPKPQPAPIPADAKEPGTWLSIGEVVNRYRAAGWADSEQTVRREIGDAIAAGYLTAYRTRGQYRRVLAADVDEWIAAKRLPARSRTGGRAGEATAPEPRRERAHPVGCRSCCCPTGPQQVVATRRRRMVPPVALALLPYGRWGILEAPVPTNPSGSEALPPWVAGDEAPRQASALTGRLSRSLHGLGSPSSVSGFR